MRFDVQMNICFYEFDSEEGPYTTGADVTTKATWATARASRAVTSSPCRRSTPPTARRDGHRAAEMGLTMDKHHHEVALSQHELGMKFSTLVRAADNVQIYKYGVHMVAHTYGKTATFMPKPIAGDNGSGMHTHQSIWKDGKPTFAGDGYADLSETALHYIGGIIKHAKASTPSPTRPRTPTSG